MKLLIIPKPVLNNKLAVMSYCFRFQKGNELLSGQSSQVLDGVMNSPCMEVLSKVGIDAFTNGQPIFVPINKFLLLTEIEQQCTESPEKIIYLLNENVPPEDPYINAIKRLKELGYRFALENVKRYGKMARIIELCDFICISCVNDNDFRQTLANLKYQYSHLSCIATDVDSRELFNKIKYDRFDFFEGKFYSIPITKGNNAISPIKVNYIQLLNTARIDDFEIDEVATIVSHDTALSISLLKLVNSPYFGRSQNIKTIPHAIAMLGQTEVRKWITTAVSNLMAADKPDEITKLSLIRAKFAENLSKKFEMAIHAQSLFLMGLFSILDVVLEMPMSEALKIIKVSDIIYNALVNLEGDFAKILDFIYAYEAADWSKVSRFMIIYGMDTEDVYNAYIDAILWYSSIISIDI